MSQPVEVLRSFLDQLSTEAPVSNYEDFHRIFDSAGVPRALVDYVIQHGRPDRNARLRTRINLRKRGWVISAVAQPLLDRQATPNHVSVSRKKLNWLGAPSGERDALFLHATDSATATHYAFEEGGASEGLYQPFMARGFVVEGYSAMGDTPIYDGSTTGTIEAIRTRLEAPIMVAGFLKVADRTIRHLLDAVEQG